MDVARKKGAAMEEEKQKWGEGLSQMELKAQYQEKEITKKEEVRGRTRMPCACKRLCCGAQCVASGDAGCT